MPMTLTDRYASQSGGGAHDGTTEADAWSIAEAEAAAIAGGFCINVKGNVSTATFAFTAGTSDTGMNLWRFYVTTIGDLDDRNERNADGSFNTTGLPTWTATGAFTPAAHNSLANVVVLSSVAGTTFAGGSVDHFRLIKCQIVNSANNAAARCLQMDEAIDLIGCDFQCTGAAHASPIVDIDSGAYVDGCSFKTTQAAICLGVDHGTVVGCSFRGHAGSTGLAWLLASTSSLRHFAKNNTFHGLTTDVTHPNADSAAVMVFVGNSFTDTSGTAISSSFATNSGTLEVHNRFRDVATAWVNTNGAIIYEELTDTGGAATDYVDATNGDFRLIPTAPGRNNAIGVNRDIGSAQHSDPSPGFIASGFIR